jgi:hypothetical protein
MSAYYLEEQGQDIKNKWFKIRHAERSNKELVKKRLYNTENE